MGALRRMAAFLLTLAEYWLYAGALVALVFLTFGIDRIDADARGAYVFRPLLIPGVLLIWPIVLWRWWQEERGALDPAYRHLPERRAHGAIWAVLAFLLPLIVIGALAMRQSLPDEGAVLLEAAQ